MTPPADGVGEEKQKEETRRARASECGGRSTAVRKQERLPGVRGGRVRRSHDDSSQLGSCLLSDEDQRFSSLKPEIVRAEGEDVGGWRKESVSEADGQAPRGPGTRVTDGFAGAGHLSRALRVGVDAGTSCPMSARFPLRTER